MLLIIDYTNLRRVYFLFPMNEYVIYIDIRHWSEELARQQEQTKTAWIYKF